MQGINAKRHGHIEKIIEKNFPNYRVIVKERIAEEEIYEYRKFWKAYVMGLLVGGFFWFWIFYIHYPR